MCGGIYRRVRSTRTAYHVTLALLASACPAAYLMPDRGAEVPSLSPIGSACTRAEAGATKRGQAWSSATKHAVGTFLCRHNSLEFLPVGGQCFEAVSADRCISVMRGPPAVAIIGYQKAILDCDHSSSCTDLEPLISKVALSRSSGLQSSRSAFFGYDLCSAAFRCVCASQAMSDLQRHGMTFK